MRRLWVQQWEGMGWREGGTGPGQTQNGRQTQTDENKQLHPTVQEESWPGILEKMSSKAYISEGHADLSGSVNATRLRVW